MAWPVIQLRVMRREPWSITARRAVDDLLTWNCKHIANATMRPAIERACREAGYEPPVICTPEELIHDEKRLR
ncbi:MAG: hypothetical protein AB1486_09325 [Planctomycetota bacterium]